MNPEDGRKGRFGLLWTAVCFWNIIDESLAWGSHHDFSYNNCNSNLKLKTCSGQADKQQTHNIKISLTQNKHKSWRRNVSIALLFWLVLSLTEYLFFFFFCSHLPELMWRWFLLQTQYVHLPQRSDRPILWIQVRSFSTSLLMSFFFFLSQLLWSFMCFLIYSVHRWWGQGDWYLAKR